MLIWYEIHFMLVLINIFFDRSVPEITIGPLANQWQINILLDIFSKPHDLT